jgi:hypothetical protein
MMVINMKEVVSGVDILAVLPSSREVRCGGLCGVSSIQDVSNGLLRGRDMAISDQYRTFCEVLCYEAHALAS